MTLIVMSVWVSATPDLCHEDSKNPLLIPHLHDATYADIRQGRASDTIKATRGWLYVLHYATLVLHHVGGSVFQPHSPANISRMVML
jgi:predicted GH43/DUF377 family glycosyl hydrolase